MARLRLFANLREAAGVAEVSIDGASVGEVVDHAAAEYGARFAAGLAHAKVWVNGDEADPSRPVAASDEIALIPPVSGGAQTYGAASGYEPAIVAVAVIILLAANLLLDTVSLMVALLVGLVGLWAADISVQSGASGEIIDPWPILAAGLMGALAATGMGAGGAGIAMAFAVVAVLGWVVLRPEARNLTSMCATVLAALIAAGATSSLTLARLSTAGDDKVAAFVAMAAASTLVTWVVGAMSRPVVDPFTAGAVVAVAVAVGVAALNSFDLIAWFLTGIVVAIALISGRGIGAAFRTGEVYLAERAAGTFAVLDGPVLAAAIFFPFLRLVG